MWLQQQLAQLHVHFCSSVCISMYVCTVGHILILMLKMLFEVHAPPQHVNMSKRCSFAICAHLFRAYSRIQWCLSVWSPAALLPCCLVLHKYKHSMGWGALNFCRMIFFLQPVGNAVQSFVCRQPFGGASSALCVQCARSATIWAFSRSRNPYFVLLWASLLFGNRF